MALAFAGPLCRYYAGPGGEPVTFVAAIEAWRRDLVASLGSNLRAELDWREDPAAAGHETDLGEAGWMALRLFALHADRPDLELPETVPALLELDRHWRESAGKKFATSRYGHLLACRLWLPADFAITFRVPLPDGGTAEIGSLPVLLAQLGRLNQRTFAADDEEIARWRALPAKAGAAFLPACQRGFAGLWEAGGLARQRAVPLVVREV